MILDRDMGNLRKQDRPPGEALGQGRAGRRERLDPWGGRGNAGRLSAWGANMPQETRAPGAAGPTPFPPPPIGALMLRRRNAFLVAGRSSRLGFAITAALILAISIAVWFAPS